MTQTLKVKFQNGSFQPVNGVPADVLEGQEAEVVYEARENPQERRPMIFGLHAGLIDWDESFNDELPDSFWLGEE